MEAIDTVMGFNVLYEHYKKIKETKVNVLELTAEGYSFIKFNEALEAQAEITAPIFFKAGRESEVEDSARRCAAYLESARQEGRKDVVEWMESRREGGYNLCLKANWDEWQAKLKEWGL